MSIDTLAEPQYGDIVEISAGLTRVSGYFVRKDDRMVYITSTIPEFPTDPCLHVAVQEPTGYYHANVEIEVLKRYNGRAD